ncbi:MAG: MerR family DNA-binding protein [Actinomycetota bacterium]|nr:MerR family DNA-binding protein [Actinomycetota bacterium]
MDGLTISKLAGEVGTSADSLRYYERIGLLPAPDRSPSGYRLYGAEAIEQVRFIKRAQRLGLRLDDIAGLVDVRDRGMCPCGGTRHLLEARLGQLDEEMASLARLRDDIRIILTESLSDDASSQASCGPNCGANLLQIRQKTSTSAAPGTRKVKRHPRASSERKAQP